MERSTTDAGILDNPWGTNTGLPTAVMVEGVTKATPDSSTPARYRLVETKNVVIFTPEGLDANAQAALLAVSAKAVARGAVYHPPLLPAARAYPYGPISSVQVNSNRSESTLRDASSRLPLRLGKQTA